MVKQSKSSRKWLDEHFNDHFVKRAQAEGYRSRAAFKLLELNEKDRIIKQNNTVVDLGAAPGGWSQIAANLVGKNGTVIGLDLLPFDPLPNVENIVGDFTEEHVLQLLESKVAKGGVDVVLSDMAPNTSGIAVADQARMMDLVELAFDFARHYLQNNGYFVVKVFQGEGFDPFLQSVRSHFKKVCIRKPEASRPRSKEVYIVASGLKGPL